MKKFSYKELDSILHGKQIYRRNEYSFDFLPDNHDELKELIGAMGTTSLSIGTLQIEISIENRKLLYVWGYHPYFNWKTASILEPEAFLGSVTLSPKHKLEPGVSLAVAEDEKWQTFHDANSGCIVVTRYEDFLTGTCIKIADDCTIELKGNSLFSLVLHVEMVDKVASPLPHNVN
ncbi:MAG: hypothetical protein KJ063_25465 [Anaerolineae bacterium]|nr:hypothetical protein [Anaerolineae bacterium]